MAYSNNRTTHTTYNTYNICEILNIPLTSKKISNAS